MKKLRTGLTVLLVFVLLVSVSAAKAQNTPLRLSVPKGWQANADSGELLGTTDPESGGACGPRVPKARG